MSSIQAKAFIMKYFFNKIRHILIKILMNRLRSGRFSNIPSVTNMSCKSFSKYGPVSKYNKNNDHDTLSCQMQKCRKLYIKANSYW